MKLLALALLFACRLAADCSGSGIAWDCTAGTTSAQIASTISSASDGAVLTFADGAYSWTSFVSLSNTKGATLICESEGGCDVTVVAGTVLGMNGNLSGDNTKTYRISGFDFIGGNNHVIWFYGAGTMHNVRIDHNTFTGQNANVVMIFFGEVSTEAYFYGLVDHNTASNASSIAFSQFIGPGGTPPSGTQGTADNMFYEDNTITITTMTNGGLGCIDGWGGQSVVYRYNTSLNCLVTAHGVTHGWGPVNLEVYNNVIQVDGGATGQGLDDCYRCFHHQGSGEFLAFNNEFGETVGPHSGQAISMTHYRSAAPAVAGYSAALEHCNGGSSNDGNRSGELGYPCRQQPGRDVNATMQPMYVWNNFWGDDSSRVAMVVENPWGVSSPSVADHVAANRDYYNAPSASAQTSSSSPFDGTSGMGFGTLANRPTTCTSEADSEDLGDGGVGYFATDQGAQGTLYMCSSTNTWTERYQPYTYPHPLAGGASEPPVSTVTPVYTRVVL